MKRLSALLFVVAMMAGCENDALYEQPTISYYPTDKATITEGGGSATLIIESSGFISGGGSATVNVTNWENLTTNPPIENGIIQLSFDENAFYDTITVSANDEQLAGDYESIFRITEVSGGIRSIGTSEFVLTVLDNDLLPIFEDDFELGNLSKWTSYSVAGTNDWEIRNFNDNNYAVCSNFQNDEAGDDWLISPAFNFDELESERLTFTTSTAFNDGNLLEVVIVENYTSGNPTVIRTLNPTLHPHRGAGFGDGFVSSGTIDLSDVSGIANIAFHFEALSMDDGTQWQLDDVVFSASGGNPVGGGGSVKSTPYSENFSSCPPEDWTIFSVASNADWECTNGYMEMDNFGADVAADDWLISPPIQLSASSALSFASFTQFSGGTIEVKLSNNYAGSGDLASASWIDLADATEAWDDNTSDNGFVNVENIDLSGFSGGSGAVYIAFRATSVGTGGGQTSLFRLDDFAVSGNGGGSGGGPSVHIADARSQDGQTVTISGVVSSNDYGFNNGQYYVQDGTGGINVFHAGNFGIVEAGDNVTITGTIGEFNGQIQIAPSSVTVNSSGNVPAPIDITSSDLTLNSSLQGTRVRLSGVSLVNPGDWPTAPISTSSGLSVDATVNGVTFTIRIDRGESFYDGSPTPPATFTLIGNLGRFEDDVQIMPFFEGDIQ